MSTVEGWELHLYCDHPGCRADAQFGGLNRADALDQARRRGWTINLKLRAPNGSAAGGNLAHCPTHSGKKPNPKPLAPGESITTLEELRAQSARSSVSGEKQ